MITNEQRERIDRQFDRQDESMIQPGTYENPLVTSKSLTTIHKRGWRKESEPNRFKIETLTIENEVSLVSISFTLPNRNKNDVFEK